VAPRAPIAPVFRGIDEGDLQLHLQVWTREEQIKRGR
jgi:hypothetical protein